MQFQLQAEQSVLEAEELAIALVEEEDRDARSRQGSNLEVGPKSTRRHPTVVTPAAVMTESWGAWSR